MLEKYFWAICFRRFSFLFAYIFILFCCCCYCFHSKENRANIYKKIKSFFCTIFVFYVLWRIDWDCRMIAECDRQYKYFSLKAKSAWNNSPKTISLIFFISSVNEFALALIIWTNNVIAITQTTRRCVWAGFRLSSTCMISETSEKKNWIRWKCKISLLLFWSMSTIFEKTVLLCLLYG